jgi:parvulin-like peptidyl-prolyl isomerase
MIPAILCLLCACSREDIYKRRYVATVNGEKIYQNEFEKRLALQKGLLSPKAFQSSINKRDLLEDEILDSMITERIILQRADELNLSVSATELEKHLIDIRKDYGEEFFSLLVASNVRYEDWREQVRNDMLISKLIEKDVNAHVQVTDPEVEDFFHEQPDFCKTEASVRVSQVVVRDAGKAQKAKARLDAGEDFATVAKEMSIGPEAARGGDLGLITRQTLPDALERVLFQLPTGKMSPVVKSPYGYHILKVVESHPAKVRSLADCREDIRGVIRAKKEEKAFAVWLEGLKLKAVVKKEPPDYKEKTKSKTSTGGNQ